MRPVPVGELTDQELRDESDRLIEEADGDRDQARFGEVVEERRRRLTAQVRAGNYHSEMSDFSRGGQDRPQADSPPHMRALVDDSIRTLERCHSEHGMSEVAAVTMERLARDRRDPSAWTARYLAAAGDEHYATAFSKILAFGSMAPMRMTREEQEAVQRVNTVEQERATLQTGTGPTGAFALPIVIDPTVMLTSNGALNPIRELARVITTSSTEWRGVSSAGVTVAYQGELVEVAEGAPTIAQPVILTEKWQGFAEFSIEVGQDWPGLLDELQRLFADARDVNDASIFYNGSGSDQPFGVRTGLAVGQRVQTSPLLAFNYGDVYLLKQAIRPRDVANATFAFHPNKIDDIWRFVAAGDTTDAPLMNEARNRILGKPVVEWTSVPTAVTTGVTQGLFGDFRAAYTVVDRIGMQAELVQHTFGAGLRPKGARGLYVYGRSGAKTVVPEALRYLES